MVMLRAVVLGVLAIAATACSGAPEPPAPPPDPRTRVGPSALPPALAFLRFGETTEANVRAWLERPGRDIQERPARFPESGDREHPTTWEGRPAARHILVSCSSFGRCDMDPFGAVEFWFAEMPGRTEPVLARVAAGVALGVDEAAALATCEPARAAIAPGAATCPWTPGFRPPREGPESLYGCLLDEEGTLEMFAHCWVTRDPPHPAHAAIIYEVYPPRSPLPPAPPLPVPPPPPPVVPVLVPDGTLPRSGPGIEARETSLACTSGDYTLSHLDLTSGAPIVADGTCHLTISDSRFAADTYAIAVRGAAQVTLTNVTLRNGGVSVEDSGRLRWDGGSLFRPVQLSDTAQFSAANLSCMGLTRSETASFEDRGGNTGCD